MQLKASLHDCYHCTSTEITQPVLGRVQSDDRPVLQEAAKDAMKEVYKISPREADCTNVSSML